MARYSVIENSLVINHVEAEPQYALSQGWVPAGESRIGDHWDGEQFTPAPADPGPTQFERDQARYAKRAAVKDQLIAYMAADNMSRVRSEVWTVEQLASLMDDPAVAAANAYMGLLAFELAAEALAAAQTPLLTPEIRADWIARLETHFYLEG